MVRYGTGAPGKNMMQEARSAATRRKKNPPVAAKPDSHSTTTAKGPIFHHYQAALVLVQQGRYDKALAALEKLLPEAPVEIRERCQMYITTCRRQLDKHALTFLTPGEHCDYAISKLNTGDYEEAREQFQEILSQYPDADCAFFGLAVLGAITGQTQDCLSNLSRAIELNPKNRQQARSDADFQSMADDPRFTELLYPEIP
jgi:tetratricopeptide (TPR) repeat protein